MSIYMADYSCKIKGKPVRQLPLRPSSASRRNNPHPAPDFPDTQVLQELKKDYSMENALLARAKEKAMSKTTWVDEMIEEKNSQRMLSKGARSDLTGFSGFRQVKVKVLEDKSLKSNGCLKGCIHGYDLNMADHFA